MTAPNLTDITAKVAANGEQKVDAVGSFLLVRSLNGSSDGALKIRFNGGNAMVANANQKFRMEPGKKFTSFTLVDASGAGVTASIAYGDGDIETTGAAAIVNTVTTKETMANGVGSIADVTLTNGVATQILPADTTRTTAVIVADPANTSSLRLGDQANIGAARGALLQAGQSYTHNSTAALYGFVTAANQKVSGTYETRT